MTEHVVRCAFMRGGTSKALMFRAQDLPTMDYSSLKPMFLSAMGSPDPYARQLDGMGGGLSSVSKVCIVGPSGHPDADVDYTFVQVMVGQAEIDLSGNCGNMSSAIGPYAVDEGLVSTPPDGEATVRIHNTNTNKIILAHFQVRGGRFHCEGDFAIDGVAGTGSPIRLSFMDPAGSKTGRVLPSGAPVDRLVLADGSTAEVSLVDAANPCVFVTADSVGVTGTELPQELDANAALLARLEAIRCAASVRMGLAPDLAAAGHLIGIPRIAIVAPPADAITLTGERRRAADMDITIRMISMGQPHRAVPMTGALCTAVAARIAGTLPNRCLSPNAAADHTVVGHPSGAVVVSADITLANGGMSVPSVTLFRTARRLFDGRVYYRLPGAEPARVKQQLFQPA